MNLDFTKQLEPFRDVCGAIVQRDLDGGDSAYRHALLICLLVLNKQTARAKTEYALLIKNNKAGFGLWRRHWAANKWYSNPNNFSRDQFQKVMLAMLLMRDYKNIFQTLLMQLLRLTFHQNIHKGTDCTGIKCYKIPDLLGVSQIIMTLRAFPMFFTVLIWALCGFKPWAFTYYYLILHVVDLSFFADLYFRKKQTWDYDSLMCVELMYATTKMPTIVSILAKEQYKKSDYQERINYNYCGNTNDICPLGVYYNLTAQEIFNEKPMKGFKK
jgi:hypothetical protein